MTAWKTKVYTTQDLESPDAEPVLTKVVDLINEMYRVHEDFINEIRFEGHSGLLSALGEDGLCAILYDDNDDDDNDNDANDLRVIATANARPLGHLETYHGHKLDEDSAATTDSPGYEIFAVTCRMDAQYKQKGLALEVTKAVIAALPCFNGPQALDSTTLWVKVADHNKPYWLRRGYTVTKSQPAKAGFWGCSRDFTIWTMKKESENPNL